MATIIHRHKSWNDRSELTAIAGGTESDNPVAVLFHYFTENNRG